MKKNNKLKIITRMSKILNLYTFDENEWGISAIANETGFSKSVVHRLVNSLVDEGFMKKDNKTKKYKLDIKFFELGKIVEKNLVLKDIAKSYMDRLSQKYNQTIILCVLDDLQQVCIERSNSGIINIASNIGRRIKLHSGASAKILLAYLPKNKRSEYYNKYGLEKYTDKTVTDREILEKELAKIRDKGFSFTIEERDKNVAAISAPIYNYKEEVIASIAIIGPKWDFQEKKIIEEYIYEIKSVAKKISQKLGFK